VFHLMGQPSRLPLSDYKAQVERICSRRYGQPVRLITAVVASYYHCGVNPSEVAADLFSEGN
jgi:hypothetical protein